MLPASISTVVPLGPLTKTELPQPDVDVVDLQVLGEDGRGEREDGGGETDVSHGTSKCSGGERLCER